MLEHHAKSLFGVPHHLFRPLPFGDIGYESVVSCDLSVVIIFQHIGISDPHDLSVLVKYAVLKRWNIYSFTEGIRVVLDNVPVVERYHFKPEPGIGGIVGRCVPRNLLAPGSMDRAEGTPVLYLHGVGIGGD